MSQDVIQPSFASGEISPSLFGRVDLAKYHAGLARARNFFIDYRGGATNRSGTGMVGRVKDSANPVRMIPFTFSTLQTYMLEFGHLYMRVIKNGGYVTEPAVNATNALLTNPATIIVPNTWNAGDWVFMSGWTGYVPLAWSTVGASLQGVYKVKAATPTQITLQDLNGNDVDATPFFPMLAAGQVSRIFTLTTPYLGSELALLKFVQNTDTMTLTHIAHAIQLLTRTQHWVWTLNPATFIPTQPTPSAVVATPSVAGVTGYNYYVSALSASGQESFVVGGSTNASATMSTTAGARVSLVWTPAAGATSYNIYRTDEVPGFAGGGTRLGFVGNVVAAAFIDANILPDFTRPPEIVVTQPFGAGENPGCVTYYQQRQVFAATQSFPQTFFMSRSGDYLNFSYALPQRANDSIVGTLASLKVNAIRAMVSLNSLLILTAEGAWRVDGGPSAAAVTPTSIEAVPQAYNGCSDVPPIVVNNDILYVQAKGASVRDLTYNFYAQVYTGSDISVLSNHLFYGKQILEWAWAEEPFKVVWVIRNDGKMLSLTFLKEQDVYAWAHHDTDGKFRSVATITEGSEDAVYMVVERLMQGNYVKFVERMASRVLGGNPEDGMPADLTKCWFLDCALRTALNFPNTNLYPNPYTNVYPPIIQPDGTVLGVSTIWDFTVIAGGAGYVSCSLNVQDIAGFGAGPFIGLLTGGVLTAIAPTNGGSGYVEPTVQVIDIGPGPGAGAKVKANVRRVIVLAMDGAPGALGTGQHLRYNGGWGTVLRTDYIAVDNRTLITIDQESPFFGLWRAVPGEWSCTIKVQTLVGLGHLEGRTVSVFADGNVLPNVVVTGGLVKIQEPAADVLVGLPIVADIQSLYADLPGEPMTSQGKRKRVAALTVRVAETRGLKVGHDFNSLFPFKERAFEAMGQPILPITGDERIALMPLYDRKAQVCIRQDQPLPATVLALVPEIEMGDVK